MAMIEAAEREGRIEPGRTTIVEATSGNTGIALAFVCAAKGYRLVLTMPQGMSREREGLLRLYGAEVHVTESLGGMDEAVEAARALAGDGDVFLPDQFSNPGQPGDPSPDDRPGDPRGARGPGRRVRGRGRNRRHDHRSGGGDPRTRAPTAGSSPSSRARRLCSPGGRPGPHRIQGIGAGFVPPVLNRDLLDEILPIDDEDAIETARELARREGVLAGISCGAAVAAALQLARAARASARPDRHGAPGLRRALRVDAVLRALSRRRPSYA